MESSFSRRSLVGLLSESMTIERTYLPGEKASGETDVGKLRLSLRRGTPRLAGFLLLEG
jgi:hypothetical protein